MTVVVTDNVDVTGVTANGVALTETGTDTWTGSIPAGSALGVQGVTVIASDAAANTATDTSATYKTALTRATAAASLSHPIMSLVTDDFLFMLFGSVTVNDPDSFFIADGSGVSVMVVRSGHGLADGDYVSARGILDVSVSPFTLTCQSGQVVKLN